MAQVIAAEGELQASKALGHAARTVVDCPQALQVSSSLSASIFTFKTNPLTNPPVPDDPRGLVHDCHIFSNFEHSHNLRLML